MGRKSSLQVPFNDCPRIGSSYFSQEWVPLYVQTQLSYVKSHLTLDAVLGIYRQQLVYLGEIRRSASYNPMDIRCCMICPPIQFQSINKGRRMQSFTRNHAVLFDAVASVFGIVRRECLGVQSRWSRAYDLKGSYADLLAFIPVFDFILSGYELVMFMRLREMSGTKPQKMAQRAVWTAEFVEKLKEEGLNFNTWCDGE